MSSACRLCLLLPVLLCARADADPDRDGDWQLFLSAARFRQLTVWGTELVAAEDGGGVYLFDSATLAMRRLTTQQGLGSNRATALLVDGDDLWVGTADGGLTRFSPDGSSRAIVGLVDFNVQDLAAEGDFLVYATPAGAGPIVDGTPGLPYTQDDGLISDDVRALAAFGGQVWFGTDQGVTRFDRGLNRFDTYLDGLVGAADRRIHDLWSDADATLIATDTGVFAFDDADSSWVRPATGLTQPVRRILRRASGEWIAVTSAGRAHRLPIGSGAWESLDLGYDDREVLCVAELSGVLWWGGAQLTQGPLFGDPQAMLWQPELGTTRLVRGLFGGSTRSLVFDAAGGFWTGAFPPSGGLNHVRADGSIHPYAYFQSSTPGVGLCGDGPKLGLLLAGNGDLWTTAYQRCVDRIRPATNDDPTAAEYQSFGSPLSSDHVVRIFEDPLGRIWFSSDGLGGREGVDILVDPSDPLDPASWLKIDPSNSQLAGAGIFGVAFAPNGRVWFSISGVGLQLWDSDGFADDGVLRGFTDPNAWLLYNSAGVGGIVEFLTPRTVAIHPDGSLWVALLGEGVLRFDPNQFRYELYEQSSFGANLLSNQVRDLVIDRRGDVWVASDIGLNRISGNGFDARIDSWTDRVAFESRLLGTRGYLPAIISPLPGSSLWALRYDAQRDVLLTGGNGGVARVDLATASVAGTEPEFRLYPNPVRADHVGVHADRFEGSATIRVYDLQGQLIVERRDYEVGDGAFWDLRTVRDEPVPSGTYMVRLEVDGRSSVRILAVER